MKELGPVGLLGLVALGSMAAQASGQEQKQVEKPKPQVAVLGVETRAPTEDEVKEHDLPFQVRAQAQLVVAVAEDSPAHEAGLVEGDFILALDANAIYSQDDIADFLRVGKPGQDVTVTVRSPGEDEVEKVELSLGGRDRTEEEAAEQVRWQFASLGQLPKALEQAAAEKKKVIVGLSGAETWWPSTRFESGPLSSLWNDPAVIKETASYIRVIVRRPHAYFFLRDNFGTKGGAMKGTMTGVSFDDGSFYPIPGIYVLNAEGVVESQVGISSEDARTDLLEVLRR